ncbi:glycerol-3-phosphate dehydrogenase subunit GlpB [Vibrio plantisponsor]|uniref:glycerol-3-phosphate dehydrogenase subunit GlpB n=1 Tax=Vibrio plantisponsor TaxID=664643 RepID=UPI00370C7EAB
MMNYDVIVIGSGIAGYSAAIKCLEHGLKTAVVSSGQSALHFSSGSIDLLSHSPLTHKLIDDPWAEIDALPTALPQHPYAKVGGKNVRSAMNWYQQMLAANGLAMSTLPSSHNHFRITTLGTLKSTWLSQPYVEKIEQNFSNLAQFKRIVMIAVDGFRDFQPHIALGNLQQHPAFKEITIKTAKVSLTAFGQLNRNPYDLRSIDISRILRDEAQFTEFANQLLKVATPEDLLMMPSIMGNGDGLELMHKLSRYTGLHLHEVPTMPPSLLGIRIEDVMMHTFIKKGGVLHKGDEVLGGQFEDQGSSINLASIQTKKMGEMNLTAKHYILASGSFFSKGLIANQNSIKEPIFNLDTEVTGERDEWHQHDFFSSKPHPFLSFGVVTDKNFTPFIQGQKVNNLHCIGAILSGYNPITHGCGGGVAVSTAYWVVEQIVAGLRSELLMKEVSA